MGSTTFGINKISTDEVINRRLEEKVNKIY